MNLARVHAVLGDRGRAFALLEGACAEHDDQLLWLEASEGLAPLRDDPRFADLRRRVGLP